MDKLNWIKVFSGIDEAKKKLDNLKPRALKYKDHRVCLVRNEDQITAMKDECPHKRVPLSKGHCTSRGEMVCYLHSYIYDLGSGAEVQGRSRDLSFLPIKIEVDGIHLGFPEEIENNPG